VATFLGAANILEGIVREGFVEVGPAKLPAQLDKARFRAGDAVKIVFRPEDVSVNRAEFFKPGHSKLSSARIEEISFVGAYERIRLRLEEDTEETGIADTPYYLTTETPDREPARTIIATRPKPEAGATKLRLGDRVVVAVTSFTVLPPVHSV
jgi:ABC-type Fe3+/spermidine/putrescine transport system ATPase subunit